MRVYREIIRTTLAEYFVYRLNFILWRVRTFISLIIVYFLWSSVFESHTQLFGYSQGEILTYIILSTLVSDIVLSTKTADIAGEIVSGKITNFTLKPISFFSYQFTRDLADKSLNIAFSLVEIIIIITLLKPPLIIQDEPYAYMLFALFVILGIFIAFFINLMLSFVGFWSAEVWAPRFIFFIIIYMLSGAYFPIDILPLPIYAILLLTPFPYFYYVPTKLYLSPETPLLPLFIVVSFLWVFLSYFFAKQVWNRGLKSFSFFGR